MVNKNGSLILYKSHGNESQLSLLCIQVVCLWEFNIDINVLEGDGGKLSRTGIALGLLLLINYDPNTG